MDGYGEHRQEREKMRNGEQETAKNDFASEKEIDDRVYYVLYWPSSFVRRHSIHIIGVYLFFFVPFFFFFLLRYFVQDTNKKKKKRADTLGTGAATVFGRIHEVILIYICKQR